MVKPRIRRKALRRATDHRALILEVVATIPISATRAAVQEEALREAKGSGFHVNAISAMVSHLLSQGLLGTRDDATLFVTLYGMEWLTNADFTRALPAEHSRPGRKRKEK